MTQRRIAALPPIALVLLIALVILELASYLGIWLLKAGVGWEIRRVASIYAEQSDRIRQLLDPPPDSRDRIDAALGWRYRPGFVSNDDRVNSAGLRSARDYAQRPPSGVTRVAAFGDSFVYGTEVGIADSWGAKMEALDPRVEVLNYGVGGYGSDQAFLRYCGEGMALEPDIVILGFATDDLRRMVNVYRRFIDDREWPLAKPRFVFGRDGGMSLLPAPLPSRQAYEAVLREPASIRALGKHDQWYRSAVYENPVYDYSATVRLAVALWSRVHDRFIGSERLLADGAFRPEASAFRLQLAVFDAFHDAVRRNDAQPLVVFLPDRSSVEQVRRGGRAIYAPLADSVRARGLRAIDLASAFAGEPSETSTGTWFQPGGHYSPRGNEVAARALLREITREPSAHVAQAQQPTSSSVAADCIPESS